MNDEQKSDLIRRVGEWMVGKGYQKRDPKSHQMLAEYIAMSSKKILNKGILLTGDAGCGKTFWLQIFLPLLTARNSVWKAQRLASIFKRDPEDFYSIIKPYGGLDVLPEDYWDFAIDDLGQEPTVYKQESMDEALSMRYDIFKGCGGRTFLSTNLTMPQIKERYGDRIDSRLHEMCVIVPFVAGDYRKGEE